MSTAFAPGYKHDVFVSYAHVDDVQPVGVAHGWVTTFVMELRNRLAKQLGRMDNHSVWMDYRLQGNDVINPTILEKARNSATLLLILSEGYVSSEWCNRERAAFLNRVETLRSEGRRIFVIEKQRLDPSRWPRELQNLRGYPFWEWNALKTHARTLGDPAPRLDEHSYYLRLEHLSFELAVVLRQLQQQHTDDRVKVFLAEVTDDLEEKRQDVKRYLDQHGLEVLPHNYYPNNSKEFRRAQENDLTGCKLFVQLLNSTVGKCPEGAENGFPELQYRIATEISRETKLSIVQWRSPDLDLDAESQISDVQRALLEAETVMAVPIEEFKAEVVKRAVAAPEHEDGDDPKVDNGSESEKELFVFINHSDEDVELAKWCREVIKRRRKTWGYVLPFKDGSPRKLRKQLEDNLLTSDVILWLYGYVPRAWVQEQLQNFRKLAWRRKRRPLGLALCRCPPPDNPDPDIWLPRMHEIDWRTDLNETALWRFLENLETAGDP